MKLYNVYMKLFARIVVYGILGFLLAAVAAVITLKIIFPPEKLRTMAIERIGKTLDRQVKLDSVSITWRGISLNNLQISEKPDFSAGTFVSAKTAAVILRILPFLKGRINIFSLYANGLDISITSHADGSASISDLTQPSGKPSREFSGENFYIKILSLENCSFTYKDESSSTTLKISGLRANSRNITARDPFDITLKTDFLLATPYGNWATPIAANIDDIDLSAGFAGMKAKVQDIALSWNGIEGVLSGDIARFYPLDSSLKIAAKPFRSESLSGMWPAIPHTMIPPSVLKTKVKIDYDAGRLTAQNIKLTVNGISAAGGGFVDWSKENTDYDFTAAVAVEPQSETAALNTIINSWSKTPINPGDVKLTGSITAQRSRIEGKDISFTLRKSSLAGSFLFTERNDDWSGTLYVSSITSTLGQIAGLCTDRKDIVLLGKVSGSAKADFYDDKTLLTAALSIDDEEGNPASPSIKLGGQVEISTGGLEGRNLTVKLEKTTARGGFSLARTNALWDGTVRITGFNSDLEQFASFAPRLKSYALAGSVSGDLSARIKSSRFFYNAGMNITDGGITLFKTNRFADIDGHFTLSNGKVTANALTGTFNNSGFAASFGLEKSSDSVSITANAEIGDLDLTIFDQLENSDSEPEAGAPEKAAPAAVRPLNLKCSLNVSTATQNNFLAKDVTLTTDLRNIEPDLRRLSGTAALKINGGYLTDIAKKDDTRDYVKILVLPLVMLQRITAIIRIPLFPDLRNITYTSIEGDYAFENGRMLIKKSVMDSSAALVNISGEINLADREIDALISAKVRGLVGSVSGPLVFHVGGTFGKPDIDFKPLELISLPGKPFEKLYNATKSLFK